MMGGIGNIGDFCSKRAVAAVATMILLAAAALLFVFRINRFSIAVVMNGEAECSLEFGTHYQEHGANSFLCGSLLFKEGIRLPDSCVEVYNGVQEDTLGRYSVCYAASVLGLRSEAARTVCVVDTVCPEITLKEDPTAFMHPEKGYEEAGYTAVDNYDGDITDRVVCSISDGKILYSVIDSSGNPAYAERQVYDHDFIPPEIHLIEGEHYVLPAGTPYSEPGYTVTDNYDTNLEDRVTVEGEVNWLVPGTYFLTYSVRDSFQNYTSVTRGVEVTGAVYPSVNWPTGKTVYLTFDDGPSPYTMQLLDILDRYDAKATFFVKDTENNDIMKEIVKRGHRIGLHCASHDYHEIYSSPEAYFADLRRIQDIVYEYTGEQTVLLRFPGGSSNTVSVYTCSGIMTILSKAVRDAGFQYFDWNVDSGDTAAATTAEAVARNVIEGIAENNTSLVLQHDIHDYSVAAVEQILAWGMDNGYAFLALSEDSPGFHHDLRN